MHRGIRVGVGSSDGSDGARKFDRVAVAQPHRRAMPDHPRGESARLVNAHDVDPRKRLDRGKFLDQSVPLAEANHRDGRCHRHQQNQPLRHHANDAGHGRDECLTERPVGLYLAPEQQSADRHKQPRDHAQDLVNPLLERTLGEGELLRFGGEVLCIGVFTHRRGLKGDRTRHDERTGQDRVARILVEGIGLSGDQRFVDLHTAGRKDSSVRRNLVTRGQLDEVIEDNFVDRDFGRLPVPDHRHVGCNQDAQTIERSFRSELLDDADDGVRHHDEPEQSVREMPEDQHDHEHHRHDCVEPGQEVGTENFDDRPRPAVFDGIDFACGDALADLRRREPTNRGFDRHGLGTTIGATRRSVRRSRSSPQ